MVGLGTLINMAAIAAGGTAGLVFRRYLSKSLQTNLMSVMGLVCMFLGTAGTLSLMLRVSGTGPALTSTGAMMMVISFTVGTLIGTILKLVRDEELIPADAPICIVADSLASMVPNSKAEKFDKMAEGTAKDKDQLNMNDNTALARATSANFPTLALWARKYNACIIFLNQVRTKIGVMFGDPTTSPGGDSPKFYASVRIRLGASVMKDGKDKIGQDVGAECIKNKVAPPFGKCSWKFYFDPTRGLDVIESLVEHMLEEGYLPKNASGRVEIGDKKYTKSQIVDMYRDKPLPEIIAALQAIDERRAKDLSSGTTETIE